MAHLPPDLSHVGDELAAAAARSLRARRRRELAGRLAATVAAGALAFAVLGPAQLGPAQGAPAASPLMASSTPESMPARCDRPRGARFATPGCASVLTAAHVAQAALPHGTSLWRE